MDEFTAPPSESASGQLDFIPSFEENSSTQDPLGLLTDIGTVPRAESQTTLTQESSRGPSVNPVSSQVSFDQAPLYSTVPASIDPLPQVSFDQAPLYSTVPASIDPLPVQSTHGSAPLENFDSLQGGTVPPVSTGMYTPPITNAKDINKLREWEHQHEVELDNKSKKELEDKQATRQKAAEDLQRWYEDKKQLLAKRKATNRADEQVILAQRDAANQQSANPWERVASLIDQSNVKVDANTEDSGTTKRADVSRMKQILIQLKSNPLPVA